MNNLLLAIDRWLRPLLRTLPEALKSPLRRLRNRVVRLRMPVSESVLAPPGAELDENARAEYASRIEAETRIFARQVDVHALLRAGSREAVAKVLTRMH